MVKECDSVNSYNHTRMEALPEDVNHQLQGDVLDLRIEAGLPVSALGSQSVGVGGRSEVTQFQVIVKLQTLCPAHTYRQHLRALHLL